MADRSTSGRRGFTLIEILFSIAVLAILIGLLIVGVRAASASSRRAIERQNILALRQSIDAFKLEFGIVPPLVKDATRLKTAGSRTVVDVYQRSVQADLDFLRGTSIAAGDTRFSIHSLPIYLIGALGADASGASIDGVNGPGMLAVQRDGTFAISGRKYDPFFDVSRGTSGVFAEDPATGKVVLRDRYGTAYRYYAWARGDAAGAVKSVADLNVPALAGDPASLPELRDADYAIVGAGANRVFGDLLVEGASYVKQELGMSEGTADTRAETAGRGDNVVEVGR